MMVMISSGARLFLTACFALIYSRELQHASQLTCGAAIFGAFLSFLLALFSPKLSLFAVAGSLSVLPFFGNQTLNLAIASGLAGSYIRQLAGDSRRQATTTSQALICSSFPLQGAVLLMQSEAVLRLVTLIRSEADWLLLNSIRQQAGLSGVFGYLWANPGIWSQPLIGVCGIFQFGLLCELCYFSFCRLELRTSFIAGLKAGVCIAVTLLLLQVINLSPWFSINRGAFWVLTDRYPSSFTDPNSFGLMAALIALFLIAIEPSKKVLIISAVLLLSGVWSGSRTLWLMVFLSLFLALARLKRQSFPARSVPLVLAPALLILFLLTVPAINGSLQQLLPGTGLSRVLATINWDHSREMLANRFLYANLAFAAWSRAPVFGLGWGQFIEKHQLIAGSIGLNLEGWRDNANNFYLHVLAEGGIAGLGLVTIAFLLVWLVLRRGEPSSTHSSLMRLLFVFAVALLTGPHLLFDEVRYLCAAILALTAASSLDPFSNSSPRSGALTGTLKYFLVILALLFDSFSGELPFGAPVARGFYHLENGSEGAFVWSGRRGEIFLCPENRREIELSFRAYNPDLSENPLKVVLLRQGRDGTADTDLLNLGDSNWQNVILKAQHDFSPQDRIKLTIDVDRLWQPGVDVKSSAGKNNSQSDARWLGVMLKWPESVCQSK